MLYPKPLTVDIMQEIIREHPEIKDTEDENLRIIIEEALASNDNFEERVLEKLNVDTKVTEEGLVLCRNLIDYSEETEKMHRVFLFLAGVELGMAGVGTLIYLTHYMK